MECTPLATEHCGDWQHQGEISIAMPKTRQQQSFCDTCQASMSCWFPPLPLPHARNGSSPISQLQARLMPEAAPAPPSLVCAALLCSDLLCQSEKCYNISCWNGWSPSTPEHGDFAEKCISLTSAMTNGHSAKLSFQRLRAPMGRTNFCKTWAHTSVWPQPNVQKAFKIQKKKLKILDSILFFSVRFETHRMSLWNRNFQVIWCLHAKNFRCDCSWTEGER